MNDLYSNDNSLAKLLYTNGSHSSVELTKEEKGFLEKLSS